MRTIGPVQLALLEHLAAVAVRQKADARATKKRFQGGWTGVRFDRRIRLETLRGLIRRGYVTACCQAHAGTDSVRITRAGVELLESNRGETVYA